MLAERERRPIDCPVDGRKAVLTDSCPQCQTDLAPLRRVMDLPFSYYEEGINRLEAGELDSAVGPLMGAVGFEETRAAAHLALGRVFTARGSHQEALRQFDEARRLGASHEDIDGHREVALSGLSKQESERMALHRRFRRLRWLSSGAAASALALGVMISPSLTASLGRKSTPQPVSQTDASLSSRFAQMKLPDNTAVILVEGNGRIKAAGNVAASHRDQLLRDIAKLGELQDIDTTNLTVRPAAEQPREVTHIVQEGDSLWAIASRAYGRPDLWTAIHEHNRARIQAPEGLKPGDRIVLPPVTLSPR